MTDDISEHGKAIAYLVAAFPVPAWEVETIRLYAMEVEDFPAKAVQRAVREWVRQAAERPSIAELRRATVDVLRQARLAAQRKAELAREGTLQLEAVSDDEVRQVLGDLRQRIGRGMPAPLPVDTGRPEEPPEVGDRAVVARREARRGELRRQLVALDGGRKP